jgi:hypothetical protein
VEVHQQRAAGVGGVGGVHAAVRSAGQVPQQPRVRRSEQQVAALDRRAAGGLLIEQPLQLEGRRVGRDGQAGERAETIDAAVGGERVGGGGGAGVLPRDRVGHRAPRPPVPKDDGLAFVRDADRRHVGGGRARDAEGLMDALLGPLPDLPMSSSSQPGRG